FALLYHYTYPRAIMRKMNVAVVGIGYWGPGLVRNFSKIPLVNIKKVCDISRKNLQTFSATYPSIEASTDFNEIINDKDIDFIAIATPLKSHYPLAKQALLARKHVLIEKPMTDTSKEAKELLTIGKKVNKIIMVGHTFVYA